MKINKLECLLKWFKFDNIEYKENSIMEFTIFVDESGNTGNHFFESSQNFFTLGFVIVPNSKIEMQYNLIKEYKEKLCLSDELKSSNSNFNSELNIKNRLEFFYNLISNGIYFDFMCYEKNMVLAEKITEWLFDPNNNYFMNNKITEANSGRSFRKNIAELLFMSLSEEQWAELGDKFRRTNKRTRVRYLTADDIRNLIMCLKSAIEKYNKDFAQYIVIEEFKIDSILEEINDEKEYLLYEPSLFFTLIDILSCFEEKLMIESDFQLKIQVIHDKNSNDKLQNSLYSGLRYFVDNIPFLTLDFHFVDSKDEELIQVADLFAGHISRMVKNIDSYLSIEESRNFILECIDNKDSKFAFSFQTWESILKKAKVKYQSNDLALELGKWRNFVRKYK